MRKILLLVAFAHTLATSAFAIPPAEAKLYDENVSRIISEALKGAEYVEVVSSFGKNEHRIRCESKVRLVQLSMILASASYEARPLAWHGTRQHIEVYSKGEKTISIAQDGDKIRCFGSGVSGDYYVGVSVCDAVLKWANSEGSASPQREAGPRLNKPVSGE